MRILIIRHADPDYSIDSLTPAGWKEAEALAAHSPDLRIDDCYVSPLGRARATASLTLEKLGKTAEVCDWLQEFPVKLDLNQASPALRAAYNDTKRAEDGSLLPRITWDMLPSYYSLHPEYMDPESWRDSEAACCSDIVPLYNHVTQRFDELLARCGYVREGRHYRVEAPDSRTIALFCHFGVGCVLLSHLMNCSPFLLWHGMCLAPASVTEIYSEERERGIARFRMLRAGDTTHLTRAGLAPSFSARFCECYDNEEERH